MKLRAFLLISSFAVNTTAIAGSIKTNMDVDLNLSGGATAGFFYSTNTQTDDDQNFVVNDVFLELKTNKTKSGEVGFSAGAGSLAMTALTTASGEVVKAKPDLHYAVVDYAFTGNMLIEAGMLATKVGYESPTSYANDHATLGVLWSLQPTYYAGARAVYDMGGMNLYAEVSQPFAFAVGVFGDVSKIKYALNYFDRDKGDNMIDVVFSSSIGKLDFGMNFNYILRELKVGTNDDTAMGVGLYFAAKTEKVYLPLRLEYISDGTSNAYAPTEGGLGFDSGYTLTITPTLNVSKNAFLRAEFSILTAENKIFKNKNGEAKDSTVSAALQMGYRF